MIKTEELSCSICIYQHFNKRVYYFGILIISLLLNSSCGFVSHTMIITLIYQNVATRVRTTDNTIVNITVNNSIMDFRKKTKSQSQTLCQHE